MKDPLDRTGFGYIFSPAILSDKTNNFQKADPKKVAKTFESFFIFLLFKEMKKTVSLSKKSFTENTYWDILYEKASEYLAEKGIGIGNFLLKYIRAEKSKELSEDADKKTRGVDYNESQ
ncbi:MAG: hypothetical protein N2513_01620 [Deltaproteobacteria bacterium]|nr:hypothetical protein [Deltaproteobacteria bacterium]